jgi:hypothetical protein
LALLVSKSINSLCLLHREKINSEKAKEGAVIAVEVREGVEPNIRQQKEWVFSNIFSLGLISWGNTYTVKKGYDFPIHIQAGDGKIANLFLQCTGRK